MIDKIHSTLATQMATKLDSEIVGALNGFWPGCWSLVDVKRRCHIISRVGSPIQTLYADGVPILEIHPLEVETVKTETGWTLRATQNYRRLNSPAQRAGELCEEKTVGAEALLDGVWTPVWFCPDHMTMMRRDLNEDCQKCVADEKRRADNSAGGRSG